LSSIINHHLVTRVEKENMDFTDIDELLDDCCRCLRLTKKIMDSNSYEFTELRAHAHFSLVLTHLPKSPNYGKWCVEILSKYEYIEAIDWKIIVDRDDLKDMLIRIYKTRTEHTLEDYFSRIVDPVGRLVY
jgi:hypothetical protein